MSTVTHKEYLGDGVYAEFEDGMIKVTTEDGISVTNTVYLERSVYDALIRFAEATTGWEKAAS